MSRALLDRLVAETGVPYAKTSRIGMAVYRDGVQDSTELRRIEALPRRVLNLDAVPDLTPVFRLPGSTRKLWPIQSAALLEAEGAGGLLAPIGVGHGKALISFLLPEVLGATCAVLLVPASLVAQTEAVRAEWREHFRMHELAIISYTDLSRAETANILDSLRPDLIIADEAHNLRHKESARTKRFVRYFKENPGTRLCALSGTLTTRSLKDYAHLAELALGARSPLPGNFRDLEEWAAALDVCEFPMPPGELKRLMLPGESVRAAFRRRLVESPGVVATTEQAIGTSLVITARKPEIPGTLAAVLDRLRNDWALGFGDDGAMEELENAPDIARHAKELAAGFFYVWAWPGGNKDHEWLNAQRAWFRAVREKLVRARAGMDSPGLLTAAAERGEWTPPEWEAWAKLRHRKKPPTVAVWVSDYLIKDALTWAKEGGIVWYEHITVGEKLRAAGLPVFDAGQDEALLTTKEPAIACSIRCHSDGKNLQRYVRNYVMTSPANGKTWEQMLGRTHRPGQEADEVLVDVVLNTPELRRAWESALADAAYIEATKGNRQKLNYATKA